MNTQRINIIKSVSRVVLLASSLLLAISVSAQQANPQILLEQVAKATFERIELNRQNNGRTSKSLRLIIEQELLPHVDHQFAAFKVLGKHFRTVPKDKIPEFVDTFREYLVSNFAVALSSYEGQEVVFQPLQEIGTERDISVKAIIVGVDRPDINITFKLRKNRKTQEWKTYDLVAEGISLLSSKRTEFESIIRQQGIDAAIDAMQKKNQQPLDLASLAS